MINISFDGNRMAGILRTGPGGEDHIFAWHNRYYTNTAIYISMKINGGLDLMSKNDTSELKLRNASVSLEIGGEARAKIFEAIVMSEPGFQECIKPEYLERIKEFYNRRNNPK